MKIELIEQFTVLFRTTSFIVLMDGKAYSSWDTKEEAIKDMLAIAKEALENGYSFTLNNDL